jgi:hypothetical protein
VENRTSFSNLNPSYNEFLFATVCDEANGMRLSVLSALARANVDPWEEAMRLAAMPRAIATRTLASFLALASGACSNKPQAEAAAARLVQLLPHGGIGANAPAGIAGQLAPMTSYWWVWVGFALVMSFIMPQPHETAANPDMAPSTYSEQTPRPAKPGEAKTSAAFPTSTTAPAANAMPNTAQSASPRDDSAGMAQ